MNGKPLIESRDPALIARAYNLGLKAVPNFPQVLTLEDLVYWETNVTKIRAGVRNGFSPSAPPPVSPSSLPFGKNQHGHYLIRVVGLDLTGAAEIKRGERRGARFGDSARRLLLSTRADSYDAKHRLEEGRVYTLAVVPGKAIPSRLRTVDIQAYGREFGYQKPRGGHIVRVRELVTDDEMKTMGFGYIAGLHDPIVVYGGGPDVLIVDCGGGNSRLGTGWGSPDDQWDDVVAFAFDVPD